MYLWSILLFLFVVPLIFFWSDSVRSVFPVLAPWLPDEAEDHVIIVGEDEGVEDFSIEASLITPGRWFISETEDGVVAWIVSSNKRFRLTAGCEANEPPVLQIAHDSGRTLSNDLVLNYEYGVFPLVEGTYIGNQLIGGVGQFENVFLQKLPSEDVVTTFTVPFGSSEEIARSLNSICAPVL